MAKQPENNPQRTGIPNAGTKSAPIVKQGQEPGATKYGQGAPKKR